MLNYATATDTIPPLDLTLLESNSLAQEIFQHWVVNVTLQHPSRILVLLRPGFGACERRAVNQRRPTSSYKAGLLMCTSRCICFDGREGGRCMAQS